MNQSTLQTELIKNQLLYKVRTKLYATIKIVTVNQKGFKVFVERDNTILSRQISTLFLTDYGKVKIPGIDPKVLYKGSALVLWTSESAEHTTIVSVDTTSYCLISNRSFISRQ